VKKGIKLILILSLALALLVPTIVVADMDPVVLPADEGPHPDAQVEWWYFTGHLTGKDLFWRNHEYGFEVMINKSDPFGTAPLWLYNGHLAISDITRGTYQKRQLTFGLQPNVILPGGGYDITVGTALNIHMDGKNGVNHLSSPGFANLSYRNINLTLTQSDPFALHGGDGIIPYGPFGESGYYSQTRLDVSGTLIDHGMPVFITGGTAWMDHQWGDFINGGEGIGGWEWFSIQLDNNMEYMLYFIHDGDFQPAETVGTLVNPDGTTTGLDPASIGYTSLGTWTSPHTGNTYQQGWIVDLPGEDTLTVTPQLADQEMWNPLISVFTYWEGSCTVTGTINGSSVNGMAYQEQTQYIPMGQLFGGGGLLGGASGL